MGFNSGFKGLMYLSSVDFNFWFGGSLNPKRCLISTCLSNLGLKNFNLRWGLQPCSTHFGGGRGGRLRFTRILNSVQNIYNVIIVLKIVYINLNFSLTSYVIFVPNYCSDVPSRRVSCQMAIGQLTLTSIKFRWPYSVLKSCVQVCVCVYPCRISQVPLQQDGRQCGVPLIYHSRFPSPKGCCKTPATATI